MRPPAAVVLADRPLDASRPAHAERQARAVMGGGRMIAWKTPGPTVRTLSDLSRVRQGVSTQGAIPSRTGSARPSAETGDSP